MLRQAIQGISDLILVPGLIDLDFADVKTIMSRHGPGHDGHRLGRGENRRLLRREQRLAPAHLQVAGAARPHTAWLAPDHNLSAFWPMRDIRFHPLCCAADWPFAG